MANVLIEALACGVPVVTTRVGGNAELVEPGKNGLLVALDDATALQNALLEVLQRGWDRVSIARTMTGRTWEASAARLLQEWRLSMGSASGKIEPQHLSARV
jgi:glycosyltransferase involved in cell wall biosynthesis